MQREFESVRRLCGNALQHLREGVQQPESARIYSREEFDSLFTFRHMLDPTQHLEVRQTQLGFGFDDWEVLDQSANGFRLLRSTAGSARAPAVAVHCPHDGNSHLLAQVVWLMQEQGGRLIAGIAALPGKPQAVAARPLAREAGHAEPYSRAFMLPAVAAIGCRADLVIPPGGSIRSGCWKSTRTASAGEVAAPDRSGADLSG
jgi:hypothetical protein